MIDVLSLVRTVQDANSPKFLLEIKCTIEFSVTHICATLSISTLNLPSAQSVTWFWLPLSPQYAYIISTLSMPSTQPENLHWMRITSMLCYQLCSKTLVLTIRFNLSMHCSTERRQGRGEQCQHFKNVCVFSVGGQSIHYRPLAELLVGWISFLSLLVSFASHTFLVIYILIN